MARYMIHACPQRMWYVEEFLMPSLTAQGIAEADITLYVDTDHLGCLEACMDSFSKVPDDDKGTWHLQDDILIARDFKVMTERWEGNHVACGHCFGLHKDLSKHTGLVDVTEMWFSFPCIFIPNKIARAFTVWWYKTGKEDPQFESQRQAKRYDDTLFSIYMQWFQPNCRVYNIVPNLVAHVDYLIGGTVANEEIRNVPELFWQDTELIEKLRKDIESR